MDQLDDCISELVVMSLEGALIQGEVVQLGAQVKKYVHVDLFLDIVVSESHFLNTQADQLSVFEKVLNLLEDVVESAGCHLHPVFQNERVKLFVLHRIVKLLIHFLDELVPCGV